MQKLFVEKVNDKSRNKKKRGGPSKGTKLEQTKIDESNHLSSNTCCWLPNDFNLAKDNLI